jgi:kinesin family protein 6/9
MRGQQQQPKFDKSISEKRKDFE